MTSLTIRKMLIGHDSCFADLDTRQDITRLNSTKLSAQVASNDQLEHNRTGSVYAPSKSDTL